MHDAVDVVLLRSLLFVPGDRPDRFDKAIASSADAIVVELEDGVRAANKESARRNARALFEGTDFLGLASVVRVNGADSEHSAADLAALREWPRLPDFLRIPKVESPEHLDRWNRLADEREQAVGLIALVETPKGVHSLWDIAQSGRRLAALSFGPVDLSTALGAKIGWDSMLLARSSLVMAAAGASLLAIDGPSLRLDDPAAVGAEASRARELGFCGKLVVHPNQLAPVNEAFTPSEDELSSARRLVELAEDHGDGAIRVNGRMVDRPVLERARRVLALAARIAARHRDP